MMPLQITNQIAGYSRTPCTQYDPRASNLDQIHRVTAPAG